MVPKTVVFFCNWSSYPGLQMSRNIESQADKETQLLVSMCSGRISTELILESFQKGAWGVMVTACPTDKCEHDGNYQTVARINLLKTMLKQIGVDENRLKLEWIDKGEAAKLKSAIDTFTSEISNKGPIEINGLMN